MDKTMRTCIIDDDRIFVLLTTSVMKKNGFCDDFLVFLSAQEALDGLGAMIAAGEHLPDLILLDLNMPVMDGWEFLEEFEKIPNAAKANIYVVSSSIDPADRQKAKSYGCVADFVPKPITADKLKLFSRLEKIGKNQ